MSISNLYGKTILIGREPGNGRLAVAVSAGGSTKTAMIGTTGSVPRSVSRYKVETGDAHCKVDVASDGSINVSAMKPSNALFINGARITSKRIGAQTVVELGADRYAVNIAMVLAIANELLQKIVAQSQSDQAYSITHLENVWDEYNNGDIALQKRQSTIGLLCSVPIFFSMGSGVLAALSKQFEWPQWVASVTLVLTVIGIVVLAYGFYLRFTFHPIDKRKELKDRFTDDYVCPKCGNFIGFSPYKLVRKNKKCPKCGCMWTD